MRQITSLWFPGKTAIRWGKTDPVSLATSSKSANNGRSCELSLARDGLPLQG